MNPETWWQAKTNVGIKTLVEMDTCFLLCIYHCQAGHSVLQTRSEVDFQHWIVLMHGVSTLNRNITTNGISKYSNLIPLPVLMLFVAQTQASGYPYAFVQLMPIEEKSSSKQQCTMYQPVYFVHLEVQ